MAKSFFILNQFLSKSVYSTNIYIYNIYTITIYISTKILKKNDYLQYKLNCYIILLYTYISRY